MTYQPKHNRRQWWRGPGTFLAGVVAALFVTTLIAPAGLANVAAALSGTAPCVATYNADGTTDIHCDAVTPPTVPPTTTPPASPTASPSPTVTASPTASPSPSPTVTPTTPPGTLLFPNANTTGVPAGWIPGTIRTASLVILADGAIMQDTQFINANLIIKARNVIVRRVEFDGGIIDLSQAGSKCNGTIIEDVSMLNGPGEVTTQNGGPVIGPGGYTARRVRIDGPVEGFRISEKENCGPVVIEDSYVNIVPPQAGCPGVAWHGDGLQGYDGAALTVRHSTFRMDGTSDQCDGTSPFFYPNQLNTSANLTDVLAIGGRYYAFRLGTPGKMLGLYLVRDSKGQGGDADVRCSVLPGSSGATPGNASWSAWHATAVSGPTGYVVSRGAYQPCNTPNGGK